MRKVYLVTKGEYSDYRIEAIFSTRYRATKYRKKWGGEIETWKLDAPIPDTIVGVEMKPDGEVTDTWEIPCSVGGEGFRSFTIGSNLLTWYVKTEDKQRAIKVVNEKRIQILALGIWGDVKKVKQMMDNKLS
jgi:hypothetical protein